MKPIVVLKLHVGGFSKFFRKGHQTHLKENGLSTAMPLKISYNLTFDEFWLRPCNESTTYCLHNPIKLYVDLPHKSTMFSCRIIQEQGCGTQNLCVWLLKMMGVEVIKSMTRRCPSQPAALLNSNNLWNKSAIFGIQPQIYVYLFIFPSYILFNKLSLKLTQVSFVRNR